MARKIITLTYCIILLCISSASSVKIRTVIEDDIGSIHRCLNNPNIALKMSATPYPLSLEDVEKWYVNSRVNWLKEQTYSFSIINEDSSDFIGLIELRKPEIMSENAEIGYWLKDGYWGRGYATKAVRQTVNFAFTQTPITQLEGHCLYDNHGSIRVLEKNGFVRKSLFKKFMPARNKVGLYVKLLLLRK